MEHVSIKHDNTDKGRQNSTKWIYVAAVCALISVLAPWGRVPGLNPVTKQPNPILFGWLQGLAWLAMVDGILMVALSRVEVEGKLVFQRWALVSGLGAFCAYIGIVRLSNPEAGAMWWPAFIVSLLVLAVGLAPSERLPAKTRQAVLGAGMIVVVGLFAVVAVESFSFGQLALVIGGFAAYLANVGNAVANYPEFKRLRAEELDRIGPGV